MSYSQRRKLGRAKVEKAAGEIGVLSQRLHLFEQIVVKLLERENLSLAMTPDGKLELVDTPPQPDADPESDLEVRVLDETETNEPLNPAPENS